MQLRHGIGLAAVCMFLLWPAAATAQATGPTYTVQDGDTLFGIAFTFGSTVDELAAANGIADPSAIFPGQELLIPGLAGISGSLQFGPLAFGQTLSSEALRHGISVGQLARLNRSLNSQSLIVGQPIVSVAVEPPGVALPTAQRRVAQSGDSLLELAVGLNVDVWTLRALNRLEARRWSVQGEMLYALGGELPTTGLPPNLNSIEVGPLPAIQGQAVVVRLSAPAGSVPVGELGPWNLKFVEAAPADWIALQGIHALQDPGVLALQVGLAEQETFSQAIEIEEGDYGRETLQVPAETLDPANTAPEDELIAGVVGQVTSQKLWEGTFNFPVSYFEAFPSVFGTRRSYNGSEFIYYHTGLDLFGSSATPVLAPAVGRVAFASLLTVRGNTTYIDHGWGVFSGFLHQSQILVQPGELVEPGQIVGFVGGTGRVTGPHLHWEVWVGGVPVDPLTWTRTVLP
ncbi:MAG: LysM peptidoglycan-binding domain-containing protein [Anaerolineales bacterium]